MTGSRHIWTRCPGACGGPLRVAVDGLPGSGAGELADALVGPLRERGREALRVSAEDFLRPASLRFERGRDDPDAYYEDRYDLRGAPP